ncbi:hypothetical protein A2U01_0108910, partial [Trifolium medium]|nr:hypothetical protein [Trifolium medium]
MRVGKSSYLCPQQFVRQQQPAAATQKNEGSRKATT